MLSNITSFRYLLLSRHSKPLYFSRNLHLSLALRKKAPYEILGVSRHASQDEIRNAYLEKIKVCHPDSNPDDSTLHNQFVALQEAYDTLRNKQNVGHHNPGRSNAVRYTRPSHWDVPNKRTNYHRQQQYHDYERRQRDRARRARQYGAQGGARVLGSMAFLYVIFFYWVLVSGILRGPYRNRRRGGFEVSDRFDRK